MLHACRTAAKRVSNGQLECLNNTGWKESAGHAKPHAKSRYSADVHLMYLNSVRRVDMHALQKPARCVGGDGDGAEVEGPVLLANLLEGGAVAGVPSKPEALGFAQDSPAAPKGLVLVSEARPGAGVLQRHGTCLQQADQAQQLVYGQNSRHAII